MNQMVNMQWCNEGQGQARMMSLRARLPLLSGGGIFGLVCMCFMQDVQTSPIQLSGTRTNSRPRVDSTTPENFIPLKVRLRQM